MCCAGDGVWRRGTGSCVGRRGGRGGQGTMVGQGTHIQIDRKPGRNCRPRGFTQNPGLCGPKRRGVLRL